MVCREKQNVLANKQTTTVITRIHRLNLEKNTVSCMVYSAYVYTVIANRRWSTFFWWYEMKFIQHLAYVGFPIVLDCV